MRTTSVAKVNALIVINEGWITLSYSILIIDPFRTLIPERFSPLLCLLTNYVTTLIGFIPAF